MSELLLENLRRQILHGQAIVVVGAGVSIGATGGAGVASWTGFLEHGVTYCEDLLGTELPPGWGDRTRAQARSGDADELLGAAYGVSGRLGAPQRGEYRRWLRDSVGALRVRDRTVIEALAGLGVPIATTNYDNLIEEVTGLRAVTWRESARFERVLRGDERGVLHLHGHFEDPDSVVFGVRSYEDVLRDEYAQTMQHAMAMLRTLVFVGFGTGLDDPNFRGLRGWMGQHLRGSEYWHFRLVPDHEKPAAQAYQWGAPNFVAGSEVDRSRRVSE